LIDVDLSTRTKRTPRQNANQTPHKTTNNTTPHLDDEITKNTKGKTWYMWKPLI